MYLRECSLESKFLQMKVCISMIMFSCLCIILHELQISFLSCSSRRKKIFPPSSLDLTELCVVFNEFSELVAPATPQADFTGNPLALANYKTSILPFKALLANM